MAERLPGRKGKERGLSRKELREPADRDAGVRGECGDGTRAIRMADLPIIRTGDKGGAG